MKENPSYYAIIPASVRYDNELPAGAKLLYGEVTALSNQKGYCFASNTYFAELYGCTPQAISKWFKALEKQGHVKIEYHGDVGLQERRVSITVEGYQPQLRGVSTQVEGVSTTVEHNNTSIIIQEGIRERERAKFQPPTIEEVFTYLTDEKQIDPSTARRESEKFHNHYESNGWKVGRNKMQKWKSALAGWIGRIDEYSPTQQKGHGQKPKHLIDEETWLRTLALGHARGYK